MLRQSYEWEAQWSWWPWMKNEKFMAFNKVASWLCPTSPRYLVLRKNTLLFLLEPRCDAHQWCYQNEITALSLRNSTAKWERQTTKQFPHSVDFVSVQQQITESTVAILSGRRFISGSYMVYSLTDGRTDSSWASVKTVPWHNREL